MSMFDADSFVKALEPPAIKIDGKIYKGKLIGYLEAQNIVAKFDEMNERRKAGDFSNEDFVGYVHMMCDAIGIPADKIVALPGPAVTAALTSFLQYLARMTPPTNQTSGKN